MTISEFTNKLSGELPDLDVVRRKGYFNIKAFTKDGRYGTMIRVTKRLLAHKLQDNVFGTLARTINTAVESKRFNDNSLGGRNAT